MRPQLSSDADSLASKSRSFAGSARDHEWDARGRVGEARLTRLRERTNSFAGFVPRRDRDQRAEGIGAVTYGRAKDAMTPTPDTVAVATKLSPWPTGSRVPMSTTMEYSEPRSEWAEIPVAVVK